MTVTNPQLLDYSRHQGHCSAQKTSRSLTSHDSEWSRSSFWS